MKKTIKIGENEFKFKKDALLHYKQILNAYDFGDSLSDEHYFDLVNLLNYNNSESDYHVDIKDEPNDFEEEDIDDYDIIDIRIGKAQFNTKCFQLIYANGETEIISYRLMISKPKENLFNDFSRAARNVIHEDIRSVKQDYFDELSKNGYVPCQETGIQSKWTDLVVDHRQPNTFSVIVDRFIELNNIDLKNIEYVIDENNFFLFEDHEIINKFKNYHKEKAIFRIVRKECNSGRAYQGRVKTQKKYLKIKK